MQSLVILDKVIMALSCITISMETYFYRKPVGSKVYLIYKMSLDIIHGEMIFQENMSYFAISMLPGTIRLHDISRPSDGQAWASLCTALALVALLTFTSFSIYMKGFSHMPLPLIHYTIQSGGSHQGQSLSCLLMQWIMPLPGVLRPISLMFNKKSYVAESVLL